MFFSLIHKKLLLLAGSIQPPCVLVIWGRRSIYPWKHNPVIVKKKKKKERKGGRGFGGEVKIKQNEITSKRNYAK